MNRPVKDLIAAYRKTKPQIDKRLADFRSFTNNEKRTKDDDIFAELCFCILTANANALMCDKAICELKALGLLTRGSAGRIKPKLKGRVRFHNKKADYILGARKLFGSAGCIRIKEHLDPSDIIATRDRLVRNVKGIGYKEASHFLRNIGLGADIAILDRHILKNLHKYGVIAKIPDSVGSRKTYIAIEDKMREFSRRIRIPMDSLDLLFWSMQTGFVFK